MSEQIKKIKLLDDVSKLDVTKVEEAIQQIKGVVDVNFNVAEGIVNYVIDMWASEYDTMVSIINLLNDDFSIDSEPFFDEDEESSNEDEIIYYPVEESDEESLEDEQDLEVSQTQVQKNEIKYKFIEVGLSLICIIVGLILAGSRKTEHIAPYLYTGALSIAGYEFIFATISQIFKKDFNFINIAILIAIISSIVLGIPLGSAIFMTVKSAVGILYELFKFDASEKFGFDFDLKVGKKIEKSSRILLCAVFGACVVLAFIVPIFLGNYATNLLIYAKRATSILLIFSITPSLLYMPFSYFCVYRHALNKGVNVNNEEAYASLSNATSVAFLEQGVFFSDSSILKDDAVGCVLELYDANILETTLLSSKTKESTAKLRKELAITKSVSNLSDVAKVEEVASIKKSLESGTLVAVGSLKTDANVSVGLKDGEFDVVIKDGSLKKIPFIIKLCKRFKNIAKQNALILLVAKAVIALLCGFGVISNMAIAVTSILVISILSIANAVRNYLEII